MGLSEMLELKGKFLFISATLNSIPYFFLKDNDELTYDIKEDVRGMKALHVNKVAKE